MPRRPRPYACLGTTTHALTQVAGPNPHQVAGPNPHQVADKPADGLDERRLSPWERGASLAEGSLHAGLRLPALGISWASSVEPGCTPL